MKEENKEPQVEIKKDVKKEHHDFKKEDKHLEKELHNALETNKKLTENLKDANDRVIRLSAEIQNIGKRHNDEISDMAKYEGIDLVKKLLPIVDNFERSIAMDKTTDEKYLAGYKMIYTNMIEVLNNLGVKEIECEDKPFDPTIMDAIMTEHVEGVEKNYVLIVLQKGYIYKDKLLRPAMVKVSE